MGVTLDLSSLLGGDSVCSKEYDERNGTQMWTNAEIKYARHRKTPGNGNPFANVALKGSEVVKVVMLEAAMRSQIGIGECGAELCTRRCCRSR